MDGLKEICSIGAGNAATALSQMVDKRINMGIPSIKFIPLSKVSSVFGSSESLIVGIYCNILGDVSGEILLTFSRESAFAICEILLDKKPGKIKILGDLERSALQETGSIISSSFVNAFASIMKKSLLISVPKFAYDMAGSIIDFILIELSETYNKAVVLEIKFSDTSSRIKGEFFIIPNPSSLKLLISAVGSSFPEENK